MTAIDRCRVGEHLRQFRQDRCLRLEDVAAQLGVAPSTLSRIETGKAPVRTSYLDLMLDLYGVADEQTRRSLADMARDGQRNGWWADSSDVLPAGAGQFLGLEEAASHISVFSEQSVPALLRTGRYATAVTKACRPDIQADDVRKLVAVTMRRQQLLCSPGLRLHAIIDESALRRTVVSEPAMAEQLDRIAGLAASPRITIQCIPLASFRPVLSPSFVLLGFPDPADAETAFTRGAAGQVAMIRRGADTGVLRRAFTELAKSAMSPADSLHLINELAAQLARLRPSA